MQPSQNHCPPTNPLVPTAKPNFPQVRVVSDQSNSGHNPIRAKFSQVLKTKGNSDFDQFEFHTWTPLMEAVCERGQGSADPTWILFIHNRMQDHSQRREIYLLNDHLTLSPFSRCRSPRDHNFQRLLRRIRTVHLQSLQRKRNPTMLKQAKKRKTKQWVLISL